MLKKLNMPFNKLRMIFISLFFLGILLSGFSYPQESVNPGDISRLWNDWLKQNFNSQIPDMKGLEEIRERILNAGIKSHPGLTNALIREAKRRADKTPDVALKIIDLFEDQYIDISPEPYILSASIYFKYKREFVTAIDKLLDGIGVYLRNSIYTLELLANIAFLVCISIVFVAAIFFTIMVIKYLKLVLHDFSDLFPFFVPRLVTSLFGLMLLLLPVIFKASPIIIILIWSAMIAGYLTSKERVAMYGIGLLFILLPFIMNFLGSFILGPSHSGAFELELIRHGYFDEKIMEKLEKLHSDFPSQREIKFALALIYKKSGRFEDALKIYETIVNDNKYRHAVLNNIGNIYLAMGKIDDAIESYKASIQANPNSAEPHYNFGQALILKDPLGTEGTEEIDRSKDLSPATISYYTRIFDGKNIHRRAIDITFKRWDIIKEFFRYSPEKIELFSPVIPAVFKLRSEWSASLIGFILIAVVLVISLIQNRTQVFSSYCVKCNGVACLRCAGKPSNVKYCIDCLNIYIEKVGDQKLMLKHERRISTRNYLRKALLRVLNISLPGTGLIYNGYTFSGVFLLILIMTIFIRLITGTTLISYNLDLVHLPTLFLNIILILIMLLFYVFAQILYLRSE